MGRAVDTGMFYHNAALAMVGFIPAVVSGSETICEPNRHHVDDIVPQGRLRVIGPDCNGRTKKK